MRRLHRKTLYTQDNGLDVRVEQLERRFTGPELEYIAYGFDTPANLGPGDSVQLPMTDADYPPGQYGSASVPTAGPIRYGYSIVDSYIQSNTEGKDGFWWLTAGLEITVGGPNTFDDMHEAELRITMEIWDGGAFSGSVSPTWSNQSVDNRTVPVSGLVYLRTQALYYNGGIGATEVVRWRADLFNNTVGDTFQITPHSFTMIRYGTAFGQIVGE